MTGPAGLSALSRADQPGLEVPRPPMLPLPLLLFLGALSRPHLSWRRVGSPPHSAPFIALTPGRRRQAQPAGDPGLLSGVT